MNKNIGTVLAEKGCLVIDKFIQFILENGHALAAAVFLLCWALSF